MTTRMTRVDVAASTKAFARRGAAVGCMLISVGLSSNAYAHNPHDPVLAFGVSPDYANDKTLFMSTFAELNWGYKDLFRSTDGGANWTKLPVGIENRMDFSALRISPSFSMDGRVYAATRGEGVYESTNRGNTWHYYNTGLVGLNIGDLAIAGSRNTAFALFAAPTSGGVFRRGANDSSWKQVAPSATRVTVIAPSPDYASDATVITADSSGTLRKSSDGGATWGAIGGTNGKIVYSIAVAPGGAKEIFLGTSGNGIYYSNDGGKTFANKPANLPTEPINNVAVSPNYLNDHTVFCTTPTRSVYKSINGGGSWTLYSSGAAITKQPPLLKEFNGLYVSPNFANDGAAFLTTFDGLYSSTTGGTSWREIQTRVNIVTGVAFSTNYVQDKRVMASVYAGGGLYSSANGGLNWTRVWDGWLSWGKTLSSFDIDFLKNHLGAPTAVATRNYSQLGFTSDFGASWNVINIPDMVNNSGAVGWVYPTVIGASPRFDNDHDIYLGTRRHGVLQSLDGGKTWRGNRGVPKALTTSIAVSPNYGNDGTAFATTSGGEVWRTINGGDSWGRVGATVIKVRGGTKFTWVTLSPDYARDKFVLVGTNNGVFRSADGGNTWSIYSDADIGWSRIIQQIEFSPNFAADRQLYVNVRGRGLYRMTMSDTGWIVGKSNVGGPLLNQNVAFTEFRLSPSFAQDGTILGASDNSVYRSINRGDTWALLSSPGSN